MKMKTLIFTSAVLAATSLAKVLKTPQGDFEIVPLTWLNVPIWPGDEKGVNLNGTIDQVKRQAIELNPDWETDVLPHWTSDSAVEGRDIADGVELAKRGSHLCQSGQPACLVIDAQNQIGHMRKNWAQQIHLGNGLSCASPVCNDRVTIWVCNINFGPYTTNFDNVANAATVILDVCGWYEGTLWGEWMVSGWAFHDDGCNVLVRGPGDNYDYGCF